MKAPKKLIDKIIANLKWMKNWGRFQKFMGRDSNIDGCYEQLRIFNKRVIEKWEVRIRVQFKIHGDN